MVALSHNSEIDLASPLIVDASVAPRMTESYIRRLKESPIDVINWTVCRPWSEFPAAVDEIGRGLDLIDRHHESLQLVRGVADIVEARKSGRIAVIFGPQNALPAEGGPFALRALSELGVRILQLTYNETNAYGSGAAVVDDGLTQSGRNLISEMARLGMVLDLSHCGDRTTIEAIEFSPGPALVTHANLRSVHGSQRNKTDDHLRALAEKGGVIGITLWSPMLRFDERPSIEDYVVQISRAVELVGINHVGIGTDHSEGTDRAEWEGEFGSGGMYPNITGSLGDWYAYDTRFAEGGSSAAEMPAVVRAISEIGFTPEEMAALVGGNFMRVFSEVWK